MTHHLPGATIALAATIWSLGSISTDAQVPVLDPTPIAGCPGETIAFHTCAQAKAKAFNPPRTPDGRPDLQGFWRGRLSMDRSVEGIDATEPMTRSPFNPWSVFPSLIVDTPDRKIPYQPWAAAVGRKGQNFQQYIDPRTACGPGSLSRLFRDLVQILQPAGEPLVAFLFEDHRVTRIIPTDGRPHVGPNVKLVNGDSIGRWEGTSFVIDVTNLNGYTWFDDSGNFYTDAAHVIERLTMIDVDTIHYEIRLEDTKAYTRPWTMAWALVREKAPGFELLEEACWEGERALSVFRKSGYKYYFGNTWRSR
jgi:hypothetical protein